MFRQFREGTYLPQTVANHFDFEAPRYDFLLGFFPGYRRTIDTVVSEAKTGDRLLDLGTGTGILVFGLAKMYKELVGIDISPEMIKKAQALSLRNGLNNCTFETGEILDMEFPESSFDTIISGYTFHHLDDKSKNRLFRNIHSMLKAGGRFVFCDYMKKNMPNTVTGKIRYAASELGRRAILTLEGDILNEDEFPVTVQEYASMLGQAGFRDVKTIDFPYNTDAVFTAKK